MEALKKDQEEVLNECLKGSLHPEDFKERMLEKGLIERPFVPGWYVLEHSHTDVRTIYYLNEQVETQGSVNQYKGFGWLYNGEWSRGCSVGGKAIGTVKDKKVLRKLRKEAEKLKHSFCNWKLDDGILMGTNDCLSDCGIDWVVIFKDGNFKKYEKTTREKVGDELERISKSNFCSGITMERDSHPLSRCFGMSETTCTIEMRTPIMESSYKFDMSERHEEEVLKFLKTI